MEYVYRKVAIYKLNELLKLYEDFKQDGTMKKIKDSAANMEMLGIKKGEKSGVVHAEYIIKLRNAKYDPLFVTKSQNFPEIEDMNAKYSELMRKKNLTSTENNLLLRMIGLKKNQRN